MNAQLILYFCHTKGNLITYLSYKRQREYAMPPRGRGSTVPSSQPSLPSNRVFVVQFRAQRPGASLAYDGRVEHLVSGQEVRFHSLDELLGFMVGVLTEVGQESGPP
jgi:hypothetical protein